jgi:hypothetical protein
MINIPVLTGNIPPSDQTVFTSNVDSKRSERLEIEEATARFLAAGGKIQTIGRVTNDDSTDAGDECVPQKLPELVPYNFRDFAINPEKTSKQTTTASAAKKPAKKLTDSSPAQPVHKTKADLVPPPDLLKPIEETSMQTEKTSVITAAIGEFAAPKITVFMDEIRGCLLTEVKAIQNGNFDQARHELVISIIDKAVDTYAFEREHLEELPLLEGLDGMAWLASQPDPAPTLIASTEKDESAVANNNPKTTSPMLRPVWAAADEIKGLIDTWGLNKSVIAKQVSIEGYQFRDYLTKKSKPAPEVAVKIEMLVHSLVSDKAAAREANSGLGNEVAA